MASAECVRNARLTWRAETRADYDDGFFLALRLHHRRCRNYPTLTPRGHHTDQSPESMEAVQALPVPGPWEWRSLARRAVVHVECKGERLCFGERNDPSFIPRRGRRWPARTGGGHPFAPRLLCG